MAVSTPPLILLQRIAKHSYPHGECIRWWGAKTKNGKPHLKVDGRVITVARLVMHLRGELDLDSDVHVLHNAECKHTDCIRYEHLHLGTHQQNMIERGQAITHCPKGHEYTQENTAYWGQGKVCRTCNRERDK